MKLHIVIHVKNDDQAIKQAAIAAQCGVSHIFLISHYGADDILPRIALAIKEKHPKLKVGLNCLQSSFSEAMCFAIEAKADAIWFDDAGFHSASPSNDKKTAFLRTCEQFKSSLSHMDVFVGVDFKYQRNDPNADIPAKELLALGCIPTTSGVGTGIAASADKVQALAQKLPPHSRLALASGVSAENVHLWVGVTDVFVASSVSIDEHRLDAQKVSALVALCAQTDCVT